MNELENARKIISEVDKEIATLFEKRMEAVRIVAEYKKFWLIPKTESNAFHVIPWIGVVYSSKTHFEVVAVASPEAKTAFPLAKVAGAAKFALQSGIPPWMRYPPSVATMEIPYSPKESSVVARVVVLTIRYSSQRPIELSTIERMV